MKTPQAPRILPIAALMLLALVSGCNDDDRVAQLATQAADRQAEQNNTMAQLQRDVANGTQKLVTADAEARHEIIAVHHDLQAERTRLDTGWNSLEDERKQLAGERRTDSILVPVAEGLGGLLIVVALLGFSWHALTNIHSEAATDAELNALLVHELAASFELVGSPSSPQLTHSPPPAIEAPST